jgi:hypothetical protein
MIPFLIEAALRSVLVAIAVWAGLRAMRVSNVLAQKAAWGLVLAAAVFMPMLLPLAARIPGLPANATVVLPSHPWQLLVALRPTMALTTPVQRIPTPAREVIAAPSRTQPSNSSAEVFAKIDRNPKSTSFAPTPTIPSSYSSAPAIESHPEPSQASLFRALTPIQLAWTLYLSVVFALFCRLL